MTTATAVRDAGQTQGYAWDVSQRGDKQSVSLWCHRDMEQGLARRKRGEPLKTDGDGKPSRAYYYPAYLNQVALKFGWYSWPVEDCLSHRFVPMFDVKDSTGRVMRKRGTPEFGCPECRLAHARGEMPIKAVGIAKSAPESVLLSAQCFYGGQSGKMCGEIVFGKDQTELKDTLRLHLQTHPVRPSTYRKKRGARPKKGGSEDQPAEVTK